LTTPGLAGLLAGMNSESKVRFALVVVGPKRDERGNADIESWSNFLQNKPRIPAPNKNIEQLHENVWLIPLETDTLFLCEILQCCLAHNLPTRLLFLAESQTGLKFPPDAKRGR
jgi:hypothetical protein